MARSIAPCIFAFAEGSDEHKDALAILTRVYAESGDRGSRNVKSERVGPGAVEWIVRSAFDGDPRIALSALCGCAPAGNAPVGRFPTERPVSRLWPETYR